MVQRKRKFAEGRYYADNEKNDVVHDPILNEVVSRLKSRIKRERRVCIERFGCFEVREVKERKFWNAAGNKMSVAGKHVKISFKPSIPFKKYLNEPKSK